MYEMIVVCFGPFRRPIFAAIAKESRRKAKVHDNPHPPLLESAKSVSIPSIALRIRNVSLYALLKSVLHRKTRCKSGTDAPREREAVSLRLEVSLVARLKCV